MFTMCICIVTMYKVIRIRGKQISRLTAFTFFISSFTSLHVERTINIKEKLYNEEQRLIATDFFRGFYVISAEYVHSFKRHCLPDVALNACQVTVSASILTENHVFPADIRQAAAAGRKSAAFGELPLVTRR